MLRLSLLQIDGHHILVNWYLIKAGKNKFLQQRVDQLELMAHIADGLQLLVLKQQGQILLMVVNPMVEERDLEDYNRTMGSIQVLVASLQQFSSQYDL